MAANLTVAQLEKLLERKRARLSSLVRQRDDLRKRLQQIEARIAAIGGVPREGRKPRRRRKRPRNVRTLLEAVTDVLQHHRKGLTLKDLSAKVLATGYKTGSTNFENTVYQCLYNNQAKIAHDAKTHLYRLKG